MGVCVAKPGRVLLTGPGESLGRDVYSEANSSQDDYTHPVPNIDMTIFHPEVSTTAEEQKCQNLVQNIIPKQSSKSSENLIDCWKEKGFLLVINSHVLSVSASSISSFSDLASSLTGDSHKYVQELSGQFSRVVAKAYAIYLWVTSNDIQTLNSVYSMYEKESFGGLPFDYASLFNALCIEAGLKAEKIEGHLRRWRSLIGDEFYPNEDNYHCWNIVKTESEPILIDCTLGSGTVSCGTQHYFMVPPQHLILTHWPLDTTKQFLKSPLSLYDLKPIIPVPTTTRQLGLHPCTWSEVIKVEKTSADPVASVSFSLADVTTSFVTAKLVLKQHSAEATDKDEFQYHTFVNKINTNEFIIQAVLPTAGLFVLNIYLNTIQGNNSRHLCLSYIIESEKCHNSEVGYPYLYHLPARSFNFVPIHWNNGKKSYNCAHSRGVFSLVFEVNSDVSFYHCLIRGKATSTTVSKSCDVYHYNTLIVKDDKNLYKLLAVFPREDWWTICIAGTKTEELISGYTSLLTYHIFVEEGSEKMSYPKIILPHEIFFSPNPITATDQVTTLPFASLKSFDFYHYLTLDEPDSELWEGYSNIERVDEYDEQNHSKYILNVVFPKAGTWFVHVFCVLHNGFNEGLFKMKIIVDNPTPNTFLVQSNALSQKEYKLQLPNNGIISFADDGQPFSFEFVAADSDLDFVHELKSPNNPPVDYCTYLSRRDHQYTLNAIFPTPGKWTIELFASRARRNDYALVLNLKLLVETPAIDQCYPKIYPSFSTFGCKISQHDALMKSVCASGEFKMPFQAPLATYFFFKLEKESAEQHNDFSQQAFVYIDPDNQNRILHVIFPEHGHWKLDLYAKKIQQVAEDTTGSHILQISMHSDVCVSGTTFPLLFEHFYEPYKMYFKPQDLPLPSNIRIGKLPRTLTIDYYSPPAVKFMHYAELKMEDKGQSTEQVCCEVTEHVPTRMISDSTGLHRLWVEVANAGCWTVYLYASNAENPALPDDWIPVMRYVFCATLA